MYTTLSDPGPDPTRPECRYIRVGIHVYVYVYVYLRVRCMYTRYALGKRRRRIKKTEAAPNLLPARLPNAQPGPGPSRPNVFLQFSHSWRLSQRRCFVNSSFCRVPSPTVLLLPIVASSILFLPPPSPPPPSPPPRRSSPNIFNYTRKRAAETARLAPSSHSLIHKPLYPWPQPSQLYPWLNRALKTCGTRW